MAPPSPVLRMLLVLLGTVVTLNSVPCGLCDNPASGAGWRSGLPRRSLTSTHHKGNTRAERAAPPPQPAPAAGAGPPGQPGSGFPASFPFDTIADVARNRFAASISVGLGPGAFLPDTREVDSAIQTLLNLSSPLGGKERQGIGASCVGGISPVYLQLEFLPRIPAPAPFLELRRLLVFQVAEYEAWAAFSSNSSGLLFGRRLKQGGDTSSCSNRVLAAVYSRRAASLVLYPQEVPVVDGVLRSYGLDPEDRAGAAGVGFGIGIAVGEYFLHDKANALGRLPNVSYNRVPYSDWTGYAPVNSAYKLSDKRRWQPEIQFTQQGFRYIQDFIGAQLGSLRPFAYSSPKQFTDLAPGPSASLDPSSPAYRAQAERIIGLSANLTDFDKMQTELFNSLPVGSTLSSFYAIILFLVTKNRLSFDRTLLFSFSQALAVYDGDISVFYFKRLYDSVRPISVIRSSGLFGRIRAYGGPYQGTVDMPASEWNHYVPFQVPEPEYPSGAACLWATIATIGQLFFGTDELGWTVLVPKGTSTVEPGLTPRKDVVLRFPTFESLKPGVVLARQTAGVHFEDASETGVRLCSATSPLTFRLVQSLLAGVPVG